MLKFLCLLGLLGSTLAASIGNVDSTTEKKEPVAVLRFESDKQPDGSFSFSFEGGDKSYREETGVLQNAGTEDEALEVSGSYRYIDADGREIEVHYTAGRNGFVPVGTNILSEISAVAKAAADLPNNAHENEDQVRRKSRSHTNKVETQIPVEVIVMEEPENYPRQTVKVVANESNQGEEAAQVPTTSDNVAIIPVETTEEEAIKEVTKPESTESLKEQNETINETVKVSTEIAPPALSEQQPTTQDKPTEE